MMIDQALAYAGLGWNIVPLHGIKDDGSCTCRGCTTPGKHPFANNWPEFATSDEDLLIERLERLRVYNIGILLGPKSGVVDIEFDKEEGRKTAEVMFAGVVTPTYRSSRGAHRFFRWSEELPPIHSVDVRGLECRLGGGGRAAMSVLPPSKHSSGSNYEWLPGLSPDECDVADMPEELFLLLTNGDEKSSNGDENRRSTREIMRLGVDEGDRNTSLQRLACKFAYRSPNISDPEEQGYLWDILVALNHLKCRPPMDEQELRTIHASGIKYRTHNTTPPPCELRAAKAPAMKLSSWAQYGLAWDDEYSCWRPGDWELTIILSDPVSYRLTIPSFAEYTGDLTGAFHIPDVATYNDAKKMLNLIQSRTGSIRLESRPRQWADVWLGKAGKDGWDGLARMLIEDATEEPAPNADRVYAGVAEYLLQELAVVGDTPAKEPDPSGLPTLLEDGSIWLREAVVWDRAYQTRLFERPDVREFKRRAGLDRRASERVYPHHGANRRTFLVIEPSQFERIESLVRGEFGKKDSSLL